MNDSSKLNSSKKSPRALLAAIRKKYASEASAKSVLRMSTHDRQGAVHAMRKNQPYLLRDTASCWAIYQASCEPRQVDEAPVLRQVMNYLKHTFGSECKVPVTLCDTSKKYGGGREAGQTTLGEYSSYLERSECEGVFDKCRYLKDWHIALTKPQSPIQGALYETPLAFRDDWLNGWHDWINTRSNDGGDDYRFLYAGPKGSWTPMHHDVLLSYSWSVNLIGRKRWLLFPPACTPDLTHADGSLIADLRPYIPVKASLSKGNSLQVPTEGDSQSTLPPPTPSIARLVKQVVVVDQGLNEAIFVPSGWHHQVQSIFQ